MGGATLAAAIAGTTGGTGAGVYDYSQGSGTLVFPDITALSFTTLTIEAWGGGGGGGWGIESIIFLDGGSIETQSNPGGGGGSGAYTKTVVAVVGADTNKTLVWAVGDGGANGVAGNATGYAGGTSTVSSGTFTIAAMISTGGDGGGGAFGINGGNQGAGGTASGGVTTNTNGNGGAVQEQAGAASVLGDVNLTAGGGGDGGDPIFGGNDGQPGLAGRVRFVFS